MLSEPSVFRSGLIYAARLGMSFGAAVRNIDVAFDELRFRYAGILHRP
jgi:hypothetical protein